MDIYKHILIQIQILIYPPSLVTTTKYTLEDCFFLNYNAFIAQMKLEVSLTTNERRLGENCCKI